MANKKYVGTVFLRSKGKIYGATTRQVNAKDVADVRKKLKENFKFGNNVVTVKNIKLISEIKKRTK